MRVQGTHQGGWDRLLTFEPELLPEQGRRAPGVKIAETEVERALAASAGLEVEPDQ